MMEQEINIENDNENIDKIFVFSRPIDIIGKNPQTQKGIELVAKTRQEVFNVLDHKDDRLLVVVGPCSIHDPEAAMEYAEKLQQIIPNYEQELLILMRVYFEKPRTTVGWKGLINDPCLNNSCEINSGISLARKILVDINNLGVPTAGEFLDMITPQYLADCMSWGAIGARTTESQVHRELASGISCAIGFKNSTNGSVKVAIDAINSSKSVHTFLSVNKKGEAAVVRTKGNKHTHIILRGGENGPNYAPEHIEKACVELKAKGLNESLMVDCSHANSYKDYNKQKLVVNSIAEQINAGSNAITGVMIESNLVEGNQCLETLGRNHLEYGKSITDGCIAWDETIVFLDILADAIKQRRNRK